MLCRVSRKRSPKTKDLERENPLEKEDLENEDPLENEDLENEDPLENEDLENEDPLEKYENTKQKIEAESSLAYLQISKMAETWPGISFPSYKYRFSSPINEGKIQWNLDLTKCGKGLGKLVR